MKCETVSCLLIGPAVSTVSTALHGSAEAKYSLVFNGGFVLGLAKFTDLVVLCMRVTQSCLMI